MLNVKSVLFVMELFCNFEIRKSKFNVRRKSVSSHTLVRISKSDSSECLKMVTVLLFNIIWLKPIQCIAQEGSRSKNKTSILTFFFPIWTNALIELYVRYKRANKIRVSNFPIMIRAHSFRWWLSQDSVTRM